MEGLIPRCVKFFLTSLENRKNDWTFQVEIAYIEIYNEEVLDLLSDTKMENKIQVNSEITNLKVLINLLIS